MRVAPGLVALLAGVACTVVAPQPDRLQPDGPQPGGDAIPITIVNEDEVPADIEVTLYDAVTGSEETTLQPFALAPGDSTTVHLEPTRGRDDAFHLIINGFVATSSDFLGCGGPDDMDAPLPRSLEITVLPNGEPGVCPPEEG